VVAIDYDVDSASVQAWAPLVKWLSVVAVIASSAGLAMTLLDLLPALGLPQLVPFRSGPPVYALIRWIPMALLLAAGISCLTGRRYGRGLLVAYAWAALGVQAAYYLLITVQRTGFLPSSNMGGYFLWMGLSTVQSTALPLLVLGIARQPPVRRLFERR
jgi:hypothetical protein